LYAVEGGYDVFFEFGDQLVSDFLESVCCGWLSGVVDEVDQSGALIAPFVESLS
jgi:hypothetical protein